MLENNLNKKSIISALNSVFKSYSQVFFSDNSYFGFILLVVSFFDIWAGLSGLIAITVSLSVAYYFGFDKHRIKNGYYGFNSLLVGLGTGLNFAPGIELIIIVIFAALFTFLLTMLIEGVLAKYYLPILSIPFLFGLWTVVLSSRELSALGLSERGIFTVNEMHLLGGEVMVDLYHWFDSLAIPGFVATYFKALGAIFFQYSLLAGLLIAIGLLLYSRISFLFSIVGFSVAWIFYGFLGADLTYYGYTFIGFNYILTAIALGGHFLVPTRNSFLWVIILLPVVVLLSLSLSSLLMPYQLSIYSLPFNIAVLLFLYVLKLRIVPRTHLREVVLQLNQPERNLYYHQQALKRFQWLEYFPVSLPFFGEWSVSQGHHDTITHKAEWGNAWDFVIVDEEGKQFKNEGDFPQDYYCYDKAVLAPSYGFVVEIHDGLEDNTIGEMDLLHNWGNSIVIKHTEYLYTQISHLKKGSLKVKKGDYVKKGDIIATCGNSGRSPYPHIHFQVQSSPYIGSKTIDYPIDHYVLRTNESFNIFSYQKPNKNDLVSNIKEDELLKSAFNFIPGQELEFTLEKSGKEDEVLKWEVKADPYNNTYIYCAKSNSYAYFFNDGKLLLFKNFIGDKKSALFLFYMAIYNLPMGFYKELKIKDSFPLNLMFNNWLRVIQDLFAPFFLFLQSKYEIEFVDVDSELAPEKLDLRSKVDNFIFKRRVETTEFTIRIDKLGVKSILTSRDDKLIRTTLNDN